MYVNNQATLDTYGSLILRSAIYTKKITVGSGWVRSDDMQVTGSICKTHSKTLHENIHKDTVGRIKLYTRYIA